MISVIVPTIGRPDSIKAMLESLCLQSHKAEEVLVADGSDDDATSRVLADPRWRSSGLFVRRILCPQPNAVRQRIEAIKAATGEYLLLLDDDVVLESDCVEKMLTLIQSDSDIVGVVADYNNQDWPQPTRLWRVYLRLVLRLRGTRWQGRVVGPLLRFGYNPVPAGPAPMEWLGAGNSLVRSSAYERIGGFSQFFFNRCTNCEDVDLGIKLCRVGRIFLCPDARLAHHHAPGGRLTVALSVEDDVYNRFMVLHRTVGFTQFRSFLSIATYVVIESVSNVLGAVKRLKLDLTVELIYGRLRGLLQIARWVTQHSSFARG